MGFILIQVVSLALLVLLFHVTGRWIERVAYPRQGALQAPFVIRQALGLGAWICIAFVLAATGMLAPGIVYGLAALLILAFGVAVVSRSMELQTASWRALGPWGWRSSIAAAAIGLLLSALFLQTLWPAVGWDANVYHLTVPRLWAEHGGFRPIDFNVYSNWPLNTELLFLVAILLRDFVLAKLVHFWFGTLTLAAVFWVVRRRFGTLYGLLAAALVLCNQVVLAEFRVAYVDLAFAFFFFGAFLVLHNALRQERPDPRELWVAGLLAGLASGVKLTGAIVVLCLVVLLGMEWYRRRTSFVSLAKALAPVIVPSAVVLVAWFAKSWTFTGNPVYPFLFGAFGGPDWSLELGESLREWQRGIGMGRSPIDYLLLPVRVILMGGQGYERFEGQIHPLWLIWIPLSLWGARSSDLARRCLWIAGIYFVFWSLTSQQMRFLIAILPFLATATACSIAELLQRVLEGRRRTVAEAVVSLLIVGIVAHAGGRYIMGGWRAAGTYLKEGGTLTQTVVHPIYGFINEQLPDEARLLMVNTNHGFFCHREYLADSFFEASQTRELVEDCDSRAEVAELLRSRGLTHVLVDARSRGIRYSEAFLDFLAEPEPLAQRIHASEDGRFILLELR